MPARSQAQRSYLNARFGHAWVKKHGFDNPGKLPAYTPGHKKRPRARHDAIAKMLAAKN